MNQQEFDAACVELRTEKALRLNNLRNERLALQHELKLKLQSINAEKESAMREYRDKIYDLATTYSVRSSAFIGAQSAARSIRDIALADLDRQAHKLENDFFQKSQALRCEADKVRHESDMRRVEILKEYGIWLESKKADKAQQSQKGDAV